MKTSSEVLRVLCQCLGIFTAIRSDADMDTEEKVEMCVNINRK